MDKDVRQENVRHENVRHEMRFIFPPSKDREAIKEWMLEESIVSKYIVYIDDYLNPFSNEWLGDVYLGKDWLSQEDRSTTMINFREELYKMMED
jgi:hypothetical protein